MDIIQNNLKDIDVSLLALFASGMHSGTYLVSKTLQCGFSFTSTGAQVLPYGVIRHHTFASEYPYLITVEIEHLYICYWPGGRTIWEWTVPQVLNKAWGQKGEGRNEDLGHSFLKYGRT